MSNAPALLLDASVVVKWYQADEPEADKALAVREALLAAHREAAVSDVVLLEVANAMRHEPAAEPAIVLHALEDLVELGLPYLPFSPQALREAVLMAFARNLAIYDAYLVALAEENGFAFLTADERLLRATEDLPHVQALAAWRD